MCELLFETGHIAKGYVENEPDKFTLGFVRNNGGPVLIQGRPVLAEEPEECEADE
jgi:hypothetical protein